MYTDPTRFNSLPGWVSKPGRVGPHDVLILPTTRCAYFCNLHFLLLEPKTCMLLGRHSNHLSYSTWLLIGWLFCDGILPIASTRLWYHLLTGNSEDNVDEKLNEGFFEGKISRSKRREGERFTEICWRLDILFSFSWTVWITNLITKIEKPIIQK